MTTTFLQFIAEQRGRITVDRSTLALSDKSVGESEKAIWTLTDGTNFEYRSRVPETIADAERNAAKDYRLVKQSSFARLQIASVMP